MFSENRIWLELLAVRLLSLRRRWAEWRTLGAMDNAQLYLTIGVPIVFNGLIRLARMWYN